MRLPSILALLLLLAMLCLTPGCGDGDPAGNTDGAKADRDKRQQDDDDDDKPAFDASERYTAVRQAIERGAIAKQTFAPMIKRASSTDAAARRAFANDVAKRTAIDGPTLIVVAEMAADDPDKDVRAAADKALNQHGRAALLEIIHDEARRADAGKQENTTGAPSNAEPRLRVGVMTFALEELDDVEALLTHEDYQAKTGLPFKVTDGVRIVAPSDVFRKTLSPVETMVLSLTDAPVTLTAAGEPGAAGAGADAKSASGMAYLIPPHEQPRGPKPIEVTLTPHDDDPQQVAIDVSLARTAIDTMEDLASMLTSLRVRYGAGTPVAVLAGAETRWGHVARAIESASDAGFIDVRLMPVLEKPAAPDTLKTQRAPTPRTRETTKPSRETGADAGTPKDKPSPFDAGVGVGEDRADK